MKVLFHIGHPAHVHVFKHVIFSLISEGHEIEIVARKKEVSLDLLNSYGLPYRVIDYHSSSSVGKLTDLVRTDASMYRIVREKKPDLMICIGLPSITHVGKLLGIPSVYITDTEDAGLANSAAAPFATIICTPSCFLKNFGKKHIRFNGYKELAYLHPNYFKPDPFLLRDYHIDGPFIILRSISWKAHHDVGLSGIRDMKGLIGRLEKYGQVFITSEKELPGEYDTYRISVPPEKIHSLLYYSSLYIGEGGTMAAEAAVLGTPAIHIERNAQGVATGNFSGNFLELRDRYGLLYFFASQDEALDKAVTLLNNPGLKEDWQKKRENLMREKTDVTAWMKEFITRYPESLEKCRSSHV